MNESPVLFKTSINGWVCFSFVKYVREKKKFCLFFLYHFSLLTGQIIVSQKNNLCNKVIKKAVYTLNKVFKTVKSVFSNYISMYSV